MSNPRQLLWKARMAIPANRYKRGPVAVTKKPILDDRVSSKKSETGSAPCIEEMSVLMTCWKKFDYIDSDCMEEITAFQKCTAQAQQNRKAMMEAMKKGESKSSKLTSKQINRLLSRYPQPKVITESIE
ncbi:small ribosomal subunit protein mS37-like [Saccoglossus kowalevskii]|uniref:Coiled-coil-helix-coiled-coil-helix domain-containing protein 1-like n=1 Tax=Saccoglossus kowalevskii TaxID=10224 RepID=A0ABM0GP52_SACKO|nr:PREDICTED: coiled-coil-helix-coiled-coil-helix domain-containing protein 1-like [Saccoglossus kowalevskii]